MDGKTDSIITGRSAFFSKDLRHRYTLDRTLDINDGVGRVVFIMLNPSTADATKEDPTVRRCIRFAYAWGWRYVRVLNLFSLRSTDPQGIYDDKGADGDPRNLDTILKTCVDRGTRSIVVAWGVHGALRSRGRQVLDALWQIADHNPSIPYLKCFGKTRCGQPLHPLYLKSAQKLVNWW